MKKPRRVNASMSEHIDQFLHATVPISSGKYKAVRVARLQAITFGIEKWAWQVNQNEIFISKVLIKITTSILTFSLNTP